MNKYKKYKLTEQQVALIRSSYIPGVVTCQMLGDEYHVTRQTIHLIVTGKTWNKQKDGRRAKAQV